MGQAKKPGTELAVDLSQLAVIQGNREKKGEEKRKWLRMAKDVLEAARGRQAGRRGPARREGKNCGGRGLPKEFEKRKGERTVN